MGERDVVHEVVSALREAHRKEQEFARIPCWVLRDVHDRYTDADISHRYVATGVALIKRHTQA